jgi:hypothetical protein
MKRKLFFGLVLTFICGAVAIYVLAQQPAPPASSNKLANAVALIQADRPAEAKELLAAIGPDDAAFAAAQRYLALCLHELKDYHGFMKTACFTSASSRTSFPPFKPSKPNIRRRPA